MTSLGPWIRWPGDHPEIYFGLAAAVITLALAVAVLPLVRGGRDDQPRHDWAWGWFILAILFAGRWPTLVAPREFNPDESFLLAGAHALWHDPVFWRSVDGHTSGPLSFLLLWPAGLGFGWTGFLATRWTNLTLLVVIFVLLHQCLALLAGRRVARLVILGAVVFEALTNSVNFLHYSTEMLPMALLVGAAYAAVRRWALGGGAGWNVLGGLLLGAVPLTKLQAVPLAAAGGLAWLAAEFWLRHRENLRPKLALVAGALFPVVLFSFQITFAGEWPNVLIPYFRYNAFYAGQPLQPLGPLLASNLEYLGNEDSLFHLWLAGCLVWMPLMWLGWKNPERARRRVILLALTASMLAIGVVLYPGRPFIHYWQLTVVPFCFLTAALTASMLAAPPQPWNRTRCLLLALCTVLTTEGLVYQRVLYPNRLIRTVDYRRQFPTTGISARVATHVHPGESLAIWGWAGYVYVETGLRQAVRDSNTERLIVPSPYQQFYRDRYLADFIRARPELFLDSVGPEMHYKEPELAHDMEFPELAATVRANYVLVDAMESGRLYRRRDLVAPGNGAP